LQIIKSILVDAAFRYLLVRAETVRVTAQFARIFPDYEKVRKGQEGVKGLENSPARKKKCNAQARNEGNRRYW